MILYFNGKCVNDLSKDELIEAIEILYSREQSYLARLKDAHDSNVRFMKDIIKLKTN